MATQNFINECKKRANANRLGNFTYRSNETTEVTGTNIVLDNANSLKEMKLYGDTLQNGTPTPDGPVEIESVTGLQKIEVCQKNLLNANEGYTLGYIDTSGNFVSQNKTALFNHNIPVESGETYCFSTNASINNMVISKFDKSNTFIGRKKVTNTSYLTETMENNVAYVKFTISYDNTSAMTDEIVNNLKSMVEKNTTRSEQYEEYNGNTYEINLGKNLFDTDTAVTRFENGSGSVVSNWGTYTDGVVEITRSNGQYGATCFAGFIPKIVLGETYTLSAEVKLSGTASANDIRFGLIQSSPKTTISGKDTWIKVSKTFTATATDVADSRVDIQAWNTGNTIQTKNIQLEKGQKTSYTPYFTPIELNKIGTYEDVIKKSTGKNLFNKNSGFRNGSINASGEFEEDNTATFNQYIQVEKNTSYTLSLTEEADIINFAYYDSSKTFISIDTAIEYELSATIITPANCKYVVVMLCYAEAEEMTQEDVDYLRPMLEKGTTITTYEPFGKVWYIEKNVNKTTITDDNKGIIGSFGTQNEHNRILIFKTHLGWQDSWDSEVALLNQYKEVTSSSNVDTGCFGTNFTKGALTIWNDNFTNLVTARNILIGTEILIAQATSIVTEITNIELLNQLNSIELLNGLNNISISSSDLSTPVYIEAYDNGEINQTNNLVSMEFKDSCYVNDTIIGSMFVKSVDVKLLDLPVNTELVGETIIPKVGVKYSNDSTEYITFDNYIVESINDEQTASNTEFTAMNGGTLLDKEYICSLSFENGQAHTINEFYQDACNQLGLTPTDETFDNSEIELTGNPFQNKETIRTVLSEVEKTSCSIIKIDWTNKTISLTWLSDQIDYEFNTSDYSTLEGSLTQYGPLNVIMIGNSQLDGENVTKTDEESMVEYGEHQILIDSPYFLYTEDLRTQAIDAIYNKLDGLTYYDLILTTPYGKPFLEIGNKIRINTNENQVYDTYVLSHTFTYDGSFKSVIESPALTQEEQTVKNEYKSNSLKERVKRTEVIVDKAEGQITALTERVITDEENTYSKEQINELVQNAAEGVTNKFITNGGNNIFRNTGLWFKTDDENNPYEYWTGKVVKKQEPEYNAVNRSGLILQNDTLIQEQIVPNGTYTISFKYKKLIDLAEVSCKINDIEIELTETNDTEIIQTIEINSQEKINVQFISDTNDSCEIYDLMVNSGGVKSEYSQNQNETTTDTVNISKGITITSSETYATFKADSDGIRVFNNNDLNNPVTDFTGAGMDTNIANITEQATITEVLFKKVGNNTWINKL